MRKNQTLVLCAAFILSVLARTATAADEQTALDRYIAAPDPAYSYKLIDTFASSAQTTFVLQMTSQAYLSPAEVDRPLWNHWLVIVKPREVKSTKALLVISGGSNDQPAPRSAASTLVSIAGATGSVVAELRNVPNQPLTFAGESKSRREDSLIVYTWGKFLASGDDKWPARLPMTKSAVRAMDAVTSFCAGEAAGKLKIDGFVVTGASKRGWTTWTTAAVDKRVIGIIPLVIDTLNVEPSSIHHFEAYGFFAPAIRDYTELDIAKITSTPAYRALMRIEDPYYYRQRLTMPKFIINAAGDQYFLPDGSRFYFDGLPGTKYLRYVPNADHSLRGSDAVETIAACYQAVIETTPLPRFSWTFEQDGSVRVRAADKPEQVKLWQATNPKARDFRLMTIGPTWKSTVINDQGDGTYVGSIPKPPAGWSAFFVELTYPGPSSAFKFTTAVRVIPDTLPYKFPRKD